MLSSPEAKFQVICWQGRSFNPRSKILANCTGPQLDGQTKALIFKGACNVAGLELAPFAPFLVTPERLELQN